MILFYFCCANIRFPLKNSKFYIYILRKKAKKSVDNSKKYKKNNKLHFLKIFFVPLHPMTKYICTIMMILAVCILTGCSLFKSFSKRSTPSRSADYDYTYRQQVEDQSGWQSYNWHNDEELIRLHAVADSLIALGEEVPDELKRRLNPRNYVETIIPQVCHDIISTAKEYIGCKYGAGRMGPDRFDCSGFTSYIYQFYNITLGRSSRDQFLQGREIHDTRYLQPADLVFWTGSNKRSKDVGHVGLVVDVNEDTGEFFFIHAASTGIQIDSSTMDYYAERYRGARRIIDYK